MKKEKCQENCKDKRRTMIGGQALMEGVMMRGRTSMAMAVRGPEGRIELETVRLNKKTPWYRKVPVIRGVASFVSSMVSGVTTLLKSAEVSTPDEETPSKFAMGVAVVLGVVLAVGLFILLPSFLASLLEKLTGYQNALVSGLIEGLIRIVLFISYLLLVSRMKDIRRTFMYHGAEHRTINCFEKGLDMTVENVQKCSTRHNRCGTTFLFFVIVLSILVFALTNFLFSLTGLTVMNNWLIRLLIRLALLPLIAGLSFELLRFLALLPDNKFVNILRAPGLALQRLTTYPPDDEMAEVAIKSFKAVYEMDENENAAEIKFGERFFSDVKEEFKMRLQSKGVEPCELDFILGAVLNIKRGQMFKVVKLSKEDAKKVAEIFARRESGEPLDYCLGYSEFYGEKIFVNKSVLIPRPETELVVEAALKLIKEQDKVLDLCTGSGCIAKVISLKKPSAVVTASDLSEKALETAALNLSETLVKTVQSDMFEKLNGEKYDVIVSNPPYIETSIIESLAEEVKAQPLSALDGGGDGLTFYRRIAAEAAAHVNENGAVVLEIGFNQGDSVKAIMREVFEDVEVKKDYADLDRIVICKKLIKN